jgi:tRNA-splicing endonuclease subunit Sen54
VDVYSKLAIIPWYDPVTAPESHTSDTTLPFRVVLHVWKPSVNYKKSSPPPPDFRVAVLSTRDQTTMPTMTQLGALLESTPLDPPRGEKMERMMYMRLRHGYRNVVMAVVDQGVVSYLRVADSAFGKEKLYKNQGGPRGPKTNRGNQKSRKR